MSNDVCFTHLVHTDGSSRVDFTPQRVPCGASNNASDVFNCCSPGDTCLEGNICHFDHAQAGSTGYYMAGCTDPNFKDPKCMQHCFSEFLPDVVYNYTTQNWACCTSGTDMQLHCDQPSNDTWEDPPPEQLKVIATVPASATESGYRPSVTPTSSSSSTSAPSSAAAAATGTAAAAAVVSSSTANSGLSTGAKVGIAVAVVIAVLVIIAILAFLLFRRRRRRQQQQQPPQNGTMPYDPSSPYYKPGSPPKDFYQPGAPVEKAAAPPYSGYAHHRVEAPNNVPPQEMAAAPITPSELPPN